MASIMITKIADNIVSPLGGTTKDNFEAVLSGKSMLSLHKGNFGLPEPFCASLFDRMLMIPIIEDELGELSDYTFFEKICILSANRAIKQCNLSAAEDNVIFVLSTTKGNVDLLQNDLSDKKCHLSESASKIANYFRNSNTPIVVSNACISGVCAQITAVRELLSGRYKYAVIIGCDILSRFIVSGFQSFKALSSEQCKPYDNLRTGLNLGEAAGTMILKSGNASCDSWQYVSCSNHNDANHISGPSRTGEGSFRVLHDILKDVSTDELAFINAHGTATAYNDEMESIALHRAGLDEIPINGLKGYFGHTLGAAGIIETILSMQAIEHGVVLATKGFEEVGTSYPIKVSNSVRKTSKTAFIKILSGFGGSNAGIAYKKGGEL